jgi:hypothetical protein
LFTPSNFTSAACLFATSEGRLYRSYSGFSERIFQVASTIIVSSAWQLI